MEKNRLDALWGRYCCDCLGEIYQIKLRRKDCFFSQLGVGKCHHCREPHHLVMDVKFPYKILLFFKIQFSK